MSTDLDDKGTTPLSEDEVFESQIERAKAGDASAGRGLLRSIARGLGDGSLHPLLAQYHADCLWSHVQLGVSLDRALHVYSYQVQSTTFDPVELAAVFELLVEFGGMKKGVARAWIKTHIGASKKITENASAAVDIQALDRFEPGDAGQTDPVDGGGYRRARYLDLLLHTAGSMRRIVVEGVELK